MNLASRVQKGLKLVVQRYGKWQVSRISLRKLDMGNECNCVLGQLEGGYEAGKKALGLDFVPGTPYGFSLSSDEATFDAWDKLDLLWTNAIRRLRG